MLLCIISVLLSMIGKTYNRKKGKKLDSGDEDATE